MGKQVLLFEKPVKDLHITIFVKCSAAKSLWKKLKHF